MSYRPLTITAALYLCWATMRLADLKGWIDSWALPEMYAGVPGRGAVDAWHEALSIVEDLKLDGKDFCGGVADTAKFFAAGMPPHVLVAYKSYLESLMIYNVLAGGVGTPHQRRCGIPQGCPFPMTMVALTMRPLIILMRLVGDTQCFILADDVLILTAGRRMIGRFAQALNRTHAYLQAMGAKVAPSRSYNFASSQKTTTWLSSTK